MNPNESCIILFDGVCNLCNSGVQFLLRRDAGKKFKFASLQSETGQELLNKAGLTADIPDSFVLIRGEDYFLKSTAGLHVLKELGGAWKLLFIFIILPRPVRDFVYDAIAKSRYKLFGKSDTCMIPTPDMSSRFLM
jgi:predicted DCC family thiol-disulfide oxidoreductase YuxK